MNILFLTLGHIYDLKDRDIYTDLMREFIRNGHNVTIVTPYEHYLGLATALYFSQGAKILAIKTLNIQKANNIEKGVGTLLLGCQYKRAIKKYLKADDFDLVTYSTPPITLSSVVKFCKKKFGAASYLQLKDIFPQNAVDVGLLKKDGLLYKYFRVKEKQLYNISDFIGCMSPANVEYVLKHNPELDSLRVHICPNSIEIWPHEVLNHDLVRNKFNLPVDKPIFLYGGNLGKPQGIEFLINCLNEMKERTDCHFLIVGNGIESKKLDDWISKVEPRNITKIKYLPKTDYYKVVASCEGGLIFLDYRFTIPNFPSRLLPYLEYKIPVICATDTSSDIGRIVEENGFGFWCESKDPSDFVKCVDRMLSMDIKSLGVKGYQFLCDNYLVENTYHVIISHV